MDAHSSHQGYFSIDKKKGKKARFVEGKVDRKTQTSDDTDAYARNRLRHSALPIGAVAASVGFQDPLYFSRAFRRETGESPSAWRSAHGKTKEQGTGQP